MVSVKRIAFLALTTGFASVADALTGKTTRYWDCCKASCGWKGKASVSAPVTSCDKSDNPLTNMDTKSGCDGGSAYMCSSQTPWAINNNLSYGFAAVKLSGGTEASWCCACYQLTFTSGPASGKSMVVQATNTGGDLGDNHFDLAMPGGGVGIFNGCTAEWGAPSSGWGQQYGGISSRSECDNFPTALKAGCYWRFDWFLNSDNPSIDFKQVSCPSELTAKTGCKRNDDSNYPAPSSVSGSSTSSTATATKTTSTTYTSTKTSSGSTSGGTAAVYGQCGGSGYSGPTTCASGSTCTKLNDWYSQCLPK